MECGLFPIVSKTELSPGVFDLCVASPSMARAALPGQFVDIACEGKTLRRPISICDTDPSRGLVRLVLEIRGEGTAWLAAHAVGETLDILGPLGKGFDLAGAQEKRALFVGGGIGVPPLLFAARPYGARAHAVLGFRTAGAVILADDFTTAGAMLHLATDDGTAGHHGLVTGPARTLLQAGAADIVYACGPLPMLRAVAALAREYNVRCQVSMEQRMACGVGACLCCVCETKEPGTHRYRHVCKDGPVFDAETLAL